MVVNFEVIKCEPNFAVFKALAQKNGKSIETFGSALKGDNYKDGSFKKPKTEYKTL
jgi:hypothetical protein